MQLVSLVLLLGYTAAIHYPPMDDFKCYHSSRVGLEWYWHWVIGYWAIFTDIG